MFHLVENRQQLRSHLYSSFHVGEHTFAYKNCCVEKYKSSFQPDISFDEIWRMLRQEITAAVLADFGKKCIATGRQTHFFNLEREGVGRRYFGQKGDWKYYKLNFVRYGLRLVGERDVVIVSCYPV